MNWDAIGAVGELVGAAGVILSLIYLGIQIRQNTTSLRAMTNQQLTASSVAVNTAIGSDADAARAFFLGLTEPDSLDDVQRAQFVFLFQGSLRHLENAYYQHKAGGMDPLIWSGWVESMKGILGSPGGRLWWRSASSRFKGDFPAFVENEVLGEDTAAAFGSFAGRG